VQLEVPKPGLNPGFSNPKLGFEVQIQFWVRVKTMDFSISEIDLSICAPKNNHKLIVLLLF
jgi:hypothetical protein